MIREHSVFTGQVQSVGFRLWGTAGCSVGV
jgi:uncharacterized protein YaiE (UPF0345 family)